MACFQDAIYEICSKKSLYGSLDSSKLEKDENNDAFKERNPHMPHLGSRVRRGRDWKWDDQDNLGLGTVIGHCKKGNSKCIGNVIFFAFRLEFCNNDLIIIINSRLVDGGVGYWLAKYLPIRINTLGE